MAQTDRATGLVGETGIKEPVKAATTANITLSGEQTIDGVSCVDGNRVLVKDQTTAANNGIYEVDTGTWSRTKDCNGAYDLVQGSLVYVYNGTTNGNKIFKCTTANTITIGTSSLTFSAMDIELTGGVRVVWCGTATGTANALTLTPSVAVTTLTPGLTLLFKSSASANTGAATIAVSSLTATTVQLNGAALVAGDIQASLWYIVVYDGTNFQLNKIGIPATIHGVTFDAAITMSAAALNEAAEVSIASAATVNIGAAASNNVLITGTVTITAFDTVAAGITRKGRFSGALTFTHNATSLILPGAANITTAANHTFEAMSLGSGNWIVTKYQKADGTAVVATTASLVASATNDAATAGDLGELLSSDIVLGSPVALTNATAANITSITLTPGDWDVWASVGLTGGGTTTISYWLASISETSATSNANNNRSMRISPRSDSLAQISSMLLAIAGGRISVASNTPIYLVFDVGFATSTCSGFGILQARRRR